MRSFLSFLFGLALGAGALAWIDRHGAMPATQATQATQSAVARATRSTVPPIPPNVRMEAEMDATAWPPPNDAKPLRTAATHKPAPAPVLGMRGVDPAGPASAQSPAPLPGTEPGAMAADTSTANLPTPTGQGLVVPVAGVQPAQLVDTYTQARSGGRSHDAIDILAPRGTPVYAVEDGRIAKLFLSRPGGITLYQFDPSERLAYYYAHLDGYADGIVEGKQVKRGELIGYVGSTGNADPSAPHLHFAVFALGPEKKWWQGTAINPYPLLGGRPH